MPSLSSNLIRESNDTSSSSSSWLVILLDVWLSIFVSASHSACVDNIMHYNVYEILRWWHHPQKHKQHTMPHHATVIICNVPQSQHVGVPPPQTTLTIRMIIQQPHLYSVDWDDEVVGIALWGLMGLSPMKTKSYCCCFLRKTWCCITTMIPCGGRSTSSIIESE